MEVVYPLGLISRESGVRIPPLQPVLFQDSTAVVQLTVNQLVVGSIPTLGASIKTVCSSAGRVRGLGP